MRAQKFCPASFSKSTVNILLPLPGHAHRAPSMALREKQRTCSKRFPERAAKAGRARGPTPQKSQNTREERREIECESDLRGVTLHFTWPQTPPATGGSSSSRNATRSGPLRLARSGALRLLYAPASAARVRDAGAFSARCARHNLIVGRPSGANKATLLADSACARAQTGRAGASMGAASGTSPAEGRPLPNLTRDCV
jgi:hypothetical protein